MKREEKSKNSREKIVKAAFALFGEKGYDATTTQDIIEKTGLSRGAMYHHFKSKEEILHSISEMLNKETERYLQDLVDDNSLTAQQKISKLIYSNREDNNQRQIAHNNWIEKIPFAMVESIRNLNNVMAPYVAKILRQGVANKEFECDYPDELAEFMVISVDVWLDPVLFQRSYEEICSRLDFILLLAESIKIPIITKYEIDKLKEIYKKTDGLKNLQ